MCLWWGRAEEVGIVLLRIYLSPNPCLLVKASNKRKRPEEELTWGGWSLWRGSLVGFLRVEGVRIHETTYWFKVIYTLKKILLINRSLFTFLSIPPLSFSHTRAHTRTHTGYWNVFGSTWFSVLTDQNHFLFNFVSISLSCSLFIHVSICVPSLQPSLSLSFTNVVLLSTHAHTRRWILGSICFSKLSRLNKSFFIV